MQFTIENLGKVSKADIDLKPLTIFIGKNGSGKTYVASALWAYVTYIKSIQNNVKDFIPNHIYQIYKKTLFGIFDNDNDLSDFAFFFPFQYQDIDEIFEHIKKLMNLEIIFYSCFKFSNFSNAFFDIKNKKNDLMVSIKTNILHRDFSYTNNFEKKVEEYGVNIELEFSIEENGVLLYEDTLFSGTKINKITNNEEFYSDELLDYILFNIIEYAFLGSNFNDYYNLMYIPAARTGLMFGLHNFANTSLEQQNHFGIKRNIENQYDLTAPLNDFISKLYKETLSMSQSFNNEDEKVPSNNLINGKIIVNRQDKRFKYIPKSLNQELPLSASSSLVTETAVLSIFNNNIRKGSFVVFEEPEAHLHLSAQREMARLIVKMVNQGCHMLITTHSDTFLQQLNNLIMLNKLSENNPDILQEFNIEPDETIAGEKVSVYDFQYQDDDKTVAKLLELGDYGFISDTVNDEINNLIRQTDTIIDMIDDLKSNGE